MHPAVLLVLCALLGFIIYFFAFGMLGPLSQDFFTGDKQTVVRKGQLVGHFGGFIIVFLFAAFVYHNDPWGQPVLQGVGLLVGGFLTFALAEISERFKKQ